MERSSPWETACTQRSGRTRPVILRGKGVHVPDNAAEEGREDELCETSCHGGRDEIRAEEGHEIPVQKSMIVSDPWDTIRGKAMVSMFPSVISRYRSH